MDVSEIANVSVGLSQVPASQAKFTVPIVMVDHADVPSDKKYRIVTRSSYTTDLTASTSHLAWCTTQWGQNYNPSQVYIGRWHSAATAGTWVFHNATSVASVYAALTNTGQFQITETGGGGAVQVNPDFTGDTTMGDVCSSIQSALVAAGGDTAAYTCALDKYSRPVITSDNTGASGATFAVASPLAGTDLTGAAYLGTGFYHTGYDIEAISTALNRVLAVDNTPFICYQLGGSIAQEVAFSTAVNALNKILLCDIWDRDAKDSAATTDVGYQVEALSHQKTWLCYTEHSTGNTPAAAATQYPTAAVAGEIMPRTEATTNFALTPFSGVSESGLDSDGTTVIPLTATERTALDAKGYDYLVNPAGSVHAVNGLAAGGNEMRLMIWKMYMETKISEDIYAYLVSQNVVTYSDEDILAIQAIIKYWSDEGIKRKCIDGDTVVWNMPSASDFTSAQKATHTMTLSDVYSASFQSAVNDVTMTLSLSV